MKIIFQTKKFNVEEILENFASENIFVGHCIGKLLHIVHMENIEKH